MVYTCIHHDQEDHRFWASLDDMVRLSPFKKKKVEEGKEKKEREKGKRKEK